MGLLQCQLFQTPEAVHERLERCRVSDPDHITPGSIGEHVRKIQIALNRLSKGPGRENFNLKEDGNYGTNTAAAVKKYKSAPQRWIVQPWQQTTGPDDIVGQRTIKSLDEEMDVLENQSDASDRFVSTTEAGPRHDHTKCPTRAEGCGYPGKDGRAQHKGTPINPQGTGRKINIGGEGETKYLGFEDFVTDKSALATGPARPFTQILLPKVASDICVRSSPITFEPDDGKNHSKDDANGTQGEKEINRIARPGCRLTAASPPHYLTEQQLRFLRSLGTVLEDINIQEDDDPSQPEWDRGLRAVVIEMRGDGFYISQSGKMIRGR